MSLDYLSDAFYDGLCDVYHAEKQLLKAMPKMIRKATDEKLVKVSKSVNRAAETVGR